MEKNIPDHFLFHDLRCTSLGHIPHEAGRIEDCLIFLDKKALYSMGKNVF